MTDVFGSLDTLARVCYTASAGKGFWDDLPGEAMLGPYLGNKIALMHSELSEALEGLRKPGPDQHLPHLSQEEVEMADALIRIFDYCGARGIHIGAAVEQKLEYNATRPHKHGKAF